MGKIFASAIPIGMLDVDKSQIWLPGYTEEKRKEEEDPSSCLFDIFILLIN